MFFHTRRATPAASACLEDQGESSDAGTCQRFKEKGGSTSPSPSYTLVTTEKTPIPSPSLCKATAAKEATARHVCRDGARIACHS